MIQLIQPAARASPPSALRRRQVGLGDGSWAAKALEGAGKERARAGAQKTWVASQHAEKERHTVVTAQQLRRLGRRQARQQIQPGVPLRVGPRRDALVDAVGDFHLAAEASAPLALVASQRLGGGIASARSLGGGG